MDYRLIPPDYWEDDYDADEEKREIDAKYEEDYYDDEEAIQQADDRLEKQLERNYP